MNIFAITMMKVKYFEEKTLCSLFVRNPCSLTEIRLCRIKILFIPFETNVYAVTKVSTVIDIQ